MIKHKIIPLAKAIKSILIHKYWVYVYGRKVGLGRIHLLLHDISKFKPVELFYYAKTFYGGKFSSVRYQFGWFNHQKYNKHHAEYWWIFLAGEINQCTIPNFYMKEMIVDWLAAAKVYSGLDMFPTSREKIENWDWFMNSYKNVPLTKYNRDKINQLLSEPPFLFPPDLIEKACKKS